jgi:hypothetical protein
MTLLRPVSEEQATAKVKEVFDGTNRLADAYQIEPDVSPDPD